MINLLHGDYVLATKYDDGMSDDAWGIGFYDKTEDGRHYVKDRSGVWIRLGGFRRCESIKGSTGGYIFQNQDRLHSTNLWSLVKELEDK
jgi:hypothetical protein